MSLFAKFQLGDEERNRWLAEVIHLHYPESTNSAEMAEFVQTAAAAARRWLPLHAVEVVADLNTRKNGSAILIRNLPVDPELPPLPDDGYRPISKQTAVSEAVLLGVANLYGPTYTYKQEKLGTIPADVIPVKTLENTQSNASRGDFLPHADNHFLRREYSPEVLCLSGLVGSEAKTLLYPVDSLAAHLGPHVLRALMQPRFQVRIPQSFDLGGYEVWSPQRPLLSKEHGRWTVTATTMTGMRGVDAESSAALEQYAQALQNAPRSAVGILPGTLLAFSNVRNLHARTAFEGPRWLQRCYSRKTLHALHGASGIQAPDCVFDTRLLIH